MLGFFLLLLLKSLEGPCNFTDIKWCVCIFIHPFIARCLFYVMTENITQSFPKISLRSYCARQLWCKTCFLFLPSPTHVPLLYILIADRLNIIIIAIIYLTRYTSCMKIKESEFFNQMHDFEVEFPRQLSTSITFRYMYVSGVIYWYFGFTLLEKNCRKERILYFENINVIKSILEK